MPTTPIIDVGSLRQRVTLQENNPTIDDMGQPLDSWSDWLTRWAKIEPSTGFGYTAAEQVRNLVSHKVTMRWVAGLTPRNRVVFASRIFNVLAVLNLEERNIATVCLVQEVV